jgi:excisionase family DNA binding protein
MPEIDLIPIKDVPEILKISRMTLHRWIKEGRIAVVRLSGRKIFIRREELERFIRESER